MKIIKEEKGITLIALVVTIIVLLILAGVTIRMTLNEDNLFSRARNSTDAYNEAAYKESLAISGYSEHYDDMQEKYASDKSTPAGNSTLFSQITSEDYGKSINYSVQVTDYSNTSNPEAKETLGNWKILCKDESNVYIILDSYLPHSLAPRSDVIDFSYGEGYGISSSSVSNSSYLVEYLQSGSNWSEFASGVGGSTAMGSPSLSLIEKWYGSQITMNETFFESDLLWTNAVATSLWLSTECFVDGWSNGVYRVIPYNSEFKCRNSVMKP